MNAEIKILIARMEVEVAQIELREAKMNALKAEDYLIIAEEKTRQARIAILADLEHFEPSVKTSAAVAYANKLTTPEPTQL
tara:strand:- start:1682 stop:1924 length:243 start_codon:yes stop_codon:yes gene_type:complete